MAKKIYNTFTFVGNLIIPKDAEKFCSTFNSSDDGWENHKINFGVKDTSGSVEWVEMFGGHNLKGETKIYTIDSKKYKKMEIKWEDRMNPNKIAEVADFVRIRVSLEEEEKEFIAEEDAIKYLKTVLPKVGDQKVYIYGNWNWQEYKGNIYKKFNMKQIRLKKQGDKDGLYGKVNIFFEKDSIDEDRLSEQIIDINGFIQDYDRSTKKNVFLPQSFVINGSKLNFEEDLHKRKFNWMRDSFKVSNGWYQNQWNVKFFNGSDDVEVTMEDLTDKQREQVELGIKTFEEIKNSMGGNFKDYSKSEIRLLKPTEAFPDGAELTDYEDDDFNFVSTKDENINDIKEDEPKEEVKKELDLDDMFE